MIITYFGKQFFKIQNGDLVLAINPISQSSKYAKKASHFKADAVLISTNHKDYNGVENTTYGETKPFAIDSPGDYEVKDILIKGFLSETEIDKKKYINTIYSVVMDKVNFCFLGTLSNNILSAEAREGIVSPDILFIPLGLGLTPSVAYKLALMLEPKIIIPMDYDDNENNLKLFLKEGGSEKVERIDKLTIKRKDLEGKECEIVVFK